MDGKTYINEEETSPLGKRSFDVKMKNRIPQRSKTKRLTMRMRISSLLFLLFLRFPSSE